MNVYQDYSNNYWKHPATGEEHCWTPNEDFGLPIFSCTTSGVSYPHAVCAFQIGEDVSVFHNWRFFQFANDNIQPGNSQMTCGGSVSIRDPPHIIARWDDPCESHDTDLTLDVTDAEGNPITSANSGDTVYIVGKLIGV
jgi:hypothetical protein